MNALRFEDFEREVQPLAEKILTTVRRLSADPVAGVSRQGYSQLESDILALLSAEAVALGMTCCTDEAGNVWATLAGRDRSLPAFVSGSHVDSVPQGGNYDGLAGVVAAFTVAKYLVSANITPKRDFTILMMRCEESSYFGKAYVGSLAMMGKLKVEDLSLKHRTLDKTLGEFMQECGVSLPLVTSGKPVIDPSRIGAFVELHIEQGPMLDGLLPARCGVVTGIRGNIRHKAVHCYGETAHSGAVNKEYRHDAVMATSALIHRMENEWQQWLEQGRDLVFTVGVLNTSASAAIAVIPGTVTFTVDIRSLDDDTVEAFHTRLEQVAADEAQRRGVRFEFDRAIVSRAGHVNAELSDRVFAAAERAGVPCVRIASGAGHDTAVLSREGIPSAMIFVANQHGSHNPHEALEMADLLRGCYVLLNTVLSEE